MKTQRRLRIGSSLVAIDSNLTKAVETKVVRLDEHKDRVAAGLPFALNLSDGSGLNLRNKHCGVELNGHIFTFRCDLKTNKLGSKAS